MCLLNLIGLANDFLALRRFCWHISRNLQVEIYEDFIVDCINRLKAMFDTISALDRNNDNMARINQEAQRMIRVLTILRVYIADCDEAYSDERAILPLYRYVALAHLCTQSIASICAVQAGLECRLVAY